MGNLGIIFTGGEGPGPQTLRRLLGGAEKNAVTVAADSGLRLAEAAGLRPDWIIGDMDSLDGEEMLRDYPPERVIRHPVDKDFTDTELALALLWEKGCGSVWLMGGGGGRIDHLFGIREMFEKEPCPCRWVTADEDIYCVSARDASGGSLARRVVPGGIVSVLPLGNAPWKAESRGLKWPLNDVRWERGKLAICNVAVTYEIEINVQQGRFMIITPVEEE